MYKSITHTHTHTHILNDGLWHIVNILPKNTIAQPKILLVFSTFTIFNYFRIFGSDSPAAVVQLLWLCWLSRSGFSHEHRSSIGHTIPQVERWHAGSCYSETRNLIVVLSWDSSPAYLHVMVNVSLELITSSSSGLSRVGGVIEYPSTWPAKGRERGHQMTWLYWLIEVVLVDFSSHEKENKKSCRSPWSVSPTVNCAKMIVQTLLHTFKQVSHRTSKRLPRFVWKCCSSV